ncbi:hypothetical protein F8M41_020003 [Gigaspora margarita]|uniref:Uncharacterized protein n=1 Tax=Gigaspora margarita TaxID=4874 RepID=A0A8H4AJ37_GIGMA|nr:hypothetical protein F8M41_020003 [Gigaspora margarita]
MFQYLFFCLLIKLTKSQQIQYKYFNYTESELGDQNTPPLIADIKTYNDGTILVHIIRNESKQTDECSIIQGMSLEQKLRIRLIFLNGTVKEIDPKLKLDPINYCLLNNVVNPITVYPLQKPFILITYVNATNCSDPKSYRECGEVIDWDGISRSNMCFDGAWVNSTIQLNLNQKLGFLRCALVSNLENVWMWQQYSM